MLKKSVRAKLANYTK